MRPLPWTNHGKFIVIEGLDGAGTTTQIRELALWLKGRGYRVYETREPSSGPVAKWIRQFLQHRLFFHEDTLALLFLADRLDHAYHEQQGFLRLLQSDPRAIVLSDRYHLSTFAYQGRNRGEDYLAWLWAIHEPVPQPHLTLFLDVPPRICLQRLAQARGYHYERYEARLEEMEATRASYLRAIKYLQERGDLIWVVDGDAPEQEVARRIRRRIKAFLESDERLWEMTREDELLEEAVHLLRKGNFYIVGVRHVQNGVQLRVMHPTATKPVVVTFFRAKGRWSKITYGGDAGPQRDGVREALAPIQKRLERDWGPLFHQGRLNLES